MIIEEIIGEVNRYSSTSTNNAGVTTTKMPGGFKSVQSDAGTTVFNPDGTKMSQTRSIPGFSQELKFKGGPRIDNVKNTLTMRSGDVDVTKTTDGAGNMTSARMDAGKVGTGYGASVKVDNKGNKSASYKLSDIDRMRVSTRATPASNIANLNKLRNIGSS